MTISNEPTINVPYAKPIESLMWTAMGIQPDLAFAIQHLSQFMTSFGPENWTAVKRVFQYLKSTRDDGIAFRQNAGLELELFVDLDYANWTDTLSIGRYTVILRGGSVSWSSWKQQTVTLSTMALTEGASLVTNIFTGYKARPKSTHLDSI